MLDLNDEGINDVNSDIGGNKGKILKYISDKYPIFQSQKEIENGSGVINQAQVNQRLWDLMSEGIIFRFKGLDQIKNKYIFQYGLVPKYAEKIGKPNTEEYIEKLAKRGIIF